MSLITLNERFSSYLDEMPLVAILRGVTPDEVVGMANALIGAGIRLLEVPLNSPDPFDSIEAIRAHVGHDALVGAGTITDPSQIHALIEAGGELAVMPHADVDVIRDAVDEGLVVVPGVLTPTEAFAALRAGADALKIFPAELAAPNVLRAVRTVLPPQTRLLPVGGIQPDNMAGYWAAGAAGFGLGSGLYRPGIDAAELARRARAYVDAINALRAEEGDR
ncbi:MAG TPA: 2-dehydro-3-deoxy-6-phosphogalactonate aldolase [Gammaproteobacteria bacterium]|nr:2-dehydro-3-deoxy-6-phosphogalactonate aldolase [Gammaproteobacteria bacterium]